MPAIAGGSAINDLDFDPRFAPPNDVLLESVLVVNLPENCFIRGYDYICSDVPDYNAPLWSIAGQGQSLVCLDHTQVQPYDCMQLICEPTGGQDLEPGPPVPAGPRTTPGT